MIAQDSLRRLVTDVNRAISDADDTGELSWALPHLRAALYVIGQKNDFQAFTVAPKPEVPSEHSAATISRLNKECRSLRQRAEEAEEKLRALDGTALRPRTTRAR